MTQRRRCGATVKGVEQGAASSASPFHPRSGETSSLRLARSTADLRKALPTTLLGRGLHPDSVVPGGAVRPGADDLGGLGYAVAIGSPNTQQVDAFRERDGGLPLHPCLD